VLRQRGLRTGEGTRSISWGDGSFSAPTRQEKLALTTSICEVPRDKGKGTSEVQGSLVCDGCCQQFGRTWKEACKSLRMFTCMLDLRRETERHRAFFCQLCYAKLTARGSLEAPGLGDAVTELFLESVVESTV